MSYWSDKNTKTIRFEEGPIREALVSRQQTPRPQRKNCDRLVLILDESGSMSSQRRDIIGGLNEMIYQQRRVQPGLNSKVRFDVVKFSTTVKPVMSHTLDTVREFTNEDYMPSGSTALYDAIGSTIQRYRNEDNVICIIATDGEENASVSYSHSEIVRMLREQREDHSWNIVYLSEDISTFEQANKIGLSNGVKGCYNTAVGDRQLGNALQSQCYNENISQLRQGFSASFSGLSKF